MYLMMFIFWSFTLLQTVVDPQRTLQRAAAEPTGRWTTPQFTNGPVNYTATLGTSQRRHVLKFVNNSFLLKKTSTTTKTLKSRPPPKMD
jgi:hypothetical protein